MGIENVQERVIFARAEGYRLADAVGSSSCGELALARARNEVSLCHEKMHVNKWRKVLLFIE